MSISRAKGLKWGMLNRDLTVINSKEFVFHLWLFTSETLPGSVCVPILCIKARFSSGPSCSLLCFYRNCRGDFYCKTILFIKSWNILFIWYGNRVNSQVFFTSLTGTRRRSQANFCQNRRPMRTVRGASMCHQRASWKNWKVCISCQDIPKLFAQHFWCERQCVPYSDWHCFIIYWFNV